MRNPLTTHSHFFPFIAAFGRKKIASIRPIIVAHIQRKKISSNSVIRVIEIIIIIQQRISARTLFMSLDTWKKYFENAIAFGFCCVASASQHSHGCSVASHVQAKRSAHSFSLPLLSVCMPSVSSGCRFFFSLSVLVFLLLSLFFRFTSKWISCLVLLLHLTVVGCSSAQRDRGMWVKARAYTKTNEYGDSWIGGYGMRSEYRKEWRKKNFISWRKKWNIIEKI